MKKQRLTLHHGLKATIPSNKKIVIVKKSTGDIKTVVPKKDRQEESRALFWKLKKDSPEVFHARIPKPLDTHMPQMIRQKYGNEFSWKTIGGFLAGWTNRYNYLIAITKEKNRFNLLGEPTQEVLDYQVEFAKSKLKENDKKN